MPEAKRKREAKVAREAAKQDREPAKQDKEATRKMARAAKQDREEAKQDRQETRKMTRGVAKQDRGVRGSEENKEYLFRQCLSPHALVGYLAESDEAKGKTEEH